MKLLFDTHLLLWAAIRDSRLPKAAGDLLLNTNNQRHFSVVTLWEVAIKRSLDRSDFSVEPIWLHRGLLEAGYIPVSIEIPHIFEARRLPQIHRDPFDRMLRAQATVEALTLVTSDAVLASYAGHVTFV